MYCWNPISFVTLYDSLMKLFAYKTNLMNALLKTWSYVYKVIWVFMYQVSTLVISPVSFIASSDCVSQQQYSDDTQLYIAISRTTVDSSINSFQTAFLSHNTLGFYTMKYDWILTNLMLCFLRISMQFITHNITCIDVAGASATLFNNIKFFGVTFIPI